jgi:hypothetical protein
VVQHQEQQEQVKIQRSISTQVKIQRSISTQAKIQHQRLLPLLLI